MALKLTVEQSQGYHMTDAEARRAAEEGKARRARLRRKTEDGEDVPLAAGNQVVKLVQAGLMRNEHARAASEIAVHYHTVTRALNARSGLYAERMPKGSGEAEHPAESARTGRYMAWADWANTQAVTPRITLVDLTIDLAVDGLSLEQIRIRRMMAHRRVLRLLQFSLWQYALMAGWCDERATKAA